MRFLCVKTVGLYLYVHSVKAHYPHYFTYGLDPLSHVTCSSFDRRVFDASDDSYAELLNVQKSWALYASPHTCLDSELSSTNTWVWNVQSESQADALSKRFILYIELVLPTSGHAKCADFAMEVTTQRVNQGNTSDVFSAIKSLPAFNQCQRREPLPKHISQKRDEFGLMFEPFGQTELTSCLFHRDVEYQTLSDFVSIQATIRNINDDPIDHEYAVVVGHNEEFDGFLEFMLQWGYWIEKSTTWALGFNVTFWLFLTSCPFCWIPETIHTELCPSYTCSIMWFFLVYLSRLMTIWVLSACAADAAYDASSNTKSDLFWSRVFATVMMTIFFRIAVSVFASFPKKDIGTSKHVIRRLSLLILVSIVCSPITLVIPPLLNVAIAELWLYACKCYDDEYSDTRSTYPKQIIAPLRTSKQATSVVLDIRHLIKGRVP